MTVAKRKRLGQFFTPPQVVEFIFDAVGFRPGWTVIDPCCGDGAFLAPAQRRGPSVLVGLEQDPHALAVCRTALDPKPGHVHLLQQNGLAEIASCNGVPRKDFDLAVGNPPFNSGRFRDPQADAACSRYIDELAGLSRCKTTAMNGNCRGDWEIEVAFLLRFISLVRHGGRVAVIMPKGFFANWKLASLRVALLTSWRVDGVIELPTKTFAAVGTMVRTAVLFLTKKAPTRRSRTIITRVNDLCELSEVSAVLS